MSFNNYHLNFKGLNNSCPITLEEGYGSLKKNQTHYKHKSSSIEFDKEKYTKIANKLISKIVIPYYNTDLSELTESDRYHIYPFLLALEAYRRSEERERDPLEIFKGCLTRGPEYSTFMKELKKSAFIRATCSESLDGEIKYNTDDYLIKDIGSVFNYSYLINWEIDKKEVKDYLWMFEPVEQDKEILKEFRLTCKSLLREFPDVAELDESKVLLDLTNSRSFNQDKPYEKNKDYYEFRNNNIELRYSMGLCKRSVIHVGPENDRDSILVDFRVKPVIGLIDKQVSSIWRNDPRYMMEGNANELKQRFKSICSASCDSIWLMRDLKKEGLTKPRNLLKILLEEMSSRYPDIKILKNTGFYDNFELLVDENLRTSTDRGHGLGMANALTGAMQVVVDEMVVRRIHSSIEKESSFYIKTLVFNDDHVSHFYDRQIFEEYEYQDSIVCKGLSLLKNRKKSLFSRNGFVFCEQYFSTFGSFLNKKESYSRYLSLLPMSCTNIVEAKILTSSICNDITLPYIKENMKDFIAKFGYEFFPEEYLYPITFGGWCSYKVLGISLDLKEIEKLDYFPIVSRAYLASRENKITMKYNSKKKSKSYISPLEKLIFGKVEKLDLLNNIFLFDSLNDVRSKYFKINQNLKSKDKLWDNLRRKRLRIFKSSQSLSFYDLCKIAMSSMQSFYPPNVLIYEKKKLVQYEEKIQVKDLYLGKNSLYSYISKHESMFKVLCDLSEDYSIKKLDNLGKHISLQSFDKSIEQKIDLWGLSIGIEETGDFFLSFENKEEFFNLKMRYKEEIAWISWHLYPNEGFPLFKISEYEEDFFKSRDSVYTRPLSMDEYNFFLDKRIFDRKKIFTFVVLRDALRYTNRLLNQEDEFILILDYVEEIFFSIEETPIDEKILTLVDEGKELSSSLINYINSVDKNYSQLDLMELDIPIMDKQAEHSTLRVIKKLKKIRVFGTSRIKRELYILKNLYSRYRSDRTVTLIKKIIKLDENQETYNFIDRCIDLLEVGINIFHETRMDNVKNNDDDYSIKDDYTYVSSDHGDVIYDDEGDYCSE